MIITAGELLVEFVSLDQGCGLKRLASYSGPYPSGAPAIFIDQAARMGAKTAIYGGVGEDGFGAILLERLEKDGVDVSHVARVSDRSTGTVFVSYYADGSRVFIFHLARTAADAFQIGALPDTQESLILHVSGSSLGDAALRQRIRTLAEAVTASGGQISFDPNVRPELIRDAEARRAIDHLMEKARILLPSEADLEVLFPDLEQAEAIDALHRSGPVIVAVKLGAAGCIVSDGSRAEHLPGHTVEEADPTGAGDCFCGTFVALIERGHPPAEAGRIANAAGALSVTRRGPMEGNTTPDQIEAFLGRELKSSL